MAHLLADADLITGAQFDGVAVHRMTLSETVEHLLTELFAKHRTSELAQLSVRLTDDVADMNIECSRYAELNHLPKAQLMTGAGGHAGEMDEHFLGGFLLDSRFTDGGVQVEVIGPTLNALEAWPRLGQTVLAILDNGLDACTRGFTPGKAHDWASMQYWGHEEDETTYISESVDEIRDEFHERWQKEHPGEPLRTDSQIAEMELDMFTGRKLDASIHPKWHHSSKPFKTLPLLLPQPDTRDIEAAVGTMADPRNDVRTTYGITLADTFRIEALRTAWPAIRAACLNIKRLRKNDLNDDNRLCEGIAWEACPFLLRMNDDDCSARIFDDVINGYYESGEAQLDTNAVFLWHDVPTLQRAVKRLSNFLDLTQACEDLIRLLTNKQPTQTPVRIRL